MATATALPLAFRKTRPETCSKCWKFAAPQLCTYTCLHKKFAITLCLPDVGLPGPGTADEGRLAPMPCWAMLAGVLCGRATSPRTSNIVADAPTGRDRCCAAVLKGLAVGSPCTPAPTPAPSRGTPPTILDRMLPLSNMACMRCPTGASVSSKSTQYQSSVRQAM